jgi:tRNA threonylcarbamoyladenosine biosynthesis protein TsaE
MHASTTTQSAEETEALAARLGQNLRGGEVIELVSDLGGGKTTFVRGLAKGFGSDDKVASPTFTVSKVYKSGQKELHHFDFYRLPEAGIMSAELGELLEDPKAVVAVEWSDVVQHVLPVERLAVAITQTGETSRELTFAYPQALTYLIPEEA